MATKDRAQRDSKITLPFAALVLFEDVQIGDHQEILVK